jgi:hypothetical protein
MTFHFDDCNCNGIGFCEPCHCSCEGLLLSIEELQIIYSLLEHQYIHYENVDAHKILDRISQILREHDRLSKTGS